MIINIGQLALLYCASYYAYRGGPSSNGDWCGVFYIRANSPPTGTAWFVGAALLFFILCSSWWFFYQWGAYCGGFFVSVAPLASYASWYYGTALSFRFKINR